MIKSQQIKPKDQSHSSRDKPKQRLAAAEFFLPI